MEKIDILEIATISLLVVVAIASTIAAVIKIGLLVF